MSAERWRAAVPVLLLSALAASQAEAEEVSTNQVRALLSGYEPAPDAPVFRALGPNALPVLIALSEDHDERTYVRLRAIAATAHYRVPAVRTFLLAIARAPRQKDLFIREALLALGRAFGERALGDLRPFLDDEKPVVREGAALALARVGTPAARRLVLARLRKEASLTVRQSMRRFLEGQ